MAFIELRVQFLKCADRLVGTEYFKEEDDAGTRFILAASEGTKNGVDANNENDEPPEADKFMKYLTALVRRASTSSFNEGILGHVKETTTTSVSQVPLEQPLVASPADTPNDQPFFTDLNEPSPVTTTHEDLYRRIREKLKPRVTIKVDSGQAKSERGKDPAIIKS